MPERIDLLNADWGCYSASTTPELVEIRPVRAVALEGRGAPGGPAYLHAIETLHAIVGRVRELPGETVPFRVPPLEGLWWVDGDGPALEVPREDGVGSC